MRLWKLLKEQPKLKQKEVAELLNISRATVQRVTEKMEKANRLECKGGKRYGYWEVHE